jgi:hypothetical protein
MRTEARFSRTLAQCNIQYLDNLDYRAVIQEAARLREAFDGSRRVLNLLDARQRATSRLSGIDFATNDLKLFRRLAISV